MAQMGPVITPERFARGMTFDEYLAWIGTPENLAREAGWWLGPVRRDWSAMLREWHASLRLGPAREAAIRWLADQSGGPAKILAISEEWSSDCRRDIPMVARLAEAGGLELRIFPRDGQEVGRGPRADPLRSPNADLVNQFLRGAGGETWQSIPVVAFFTADWRYLCHYLEYPAIYHKERLAAAMQVARPGESREQARERFIEDWGALQRSPLFPLWAGAAVDEMLSALHERLAVGPDA